MSMARRWRTGLPKMCMFWPVNICFYVIIFVTSLHIRHPSSVPSMVNDHFEQNSMSQKGPIDISFTH